jgi:hypothetical protein
MTMDLLIKLREISDQILRERSDLILFAVVQPVGPFGTWEIVMSASWVVGNQFNSIKYVADLLMERLTESELTMIFPIVVLNPDDETVYDIVSHTAPWKDGIGQLDRDRVIRDTPIRRGYVLVANIESVLEKELQ